MEGKKKEEKEKRKRRKKEARSQPTKQERKRATRALLSRQKDKNVVKSPFYFAFSLNRWK